MILKFATVALWFMHLRFDSRIYRRLFITGIILAVRVPDRAPDLRRVHLMPDPSIGWHPHFDVWALIAVLGVGYWVALRRWGPRYVSPGEPPASRSQVVCFLIGLATLWVASDWPIHELSEERLFSVHMVQHLLMSLVAPPLLLVGTPGWLLRALLRPRWLLVAVRALSRPFPALLLFNGFIALSHWPAVVALAVRSELGHFASTRCCSSRRC